MYGLKNTAGNGRIVGSGIALARLGSQCRRRREVLHPWIEVKPGAGETVIPRKSAAGLPAKYSLE